jgi:hypothetical protein
MRREPTGNLRAARVMLDRQAPRSDGPPTCQPDRAAMSTAAPSRPRSCLAGQGKARAIAGRQCTETGAGSVCACSSTRHRCRGKRLLRAGVQTEDGCSIIGAVAGPPASPASKKQEYHSMPTRWSVPCRFRRPRSRTPPACRPCTPIGCCSDCARRADQA